MNIWKNIGYVMIIYLAGLQSIPQFIQAGKVDGASDFKMFYKNNYSNAITNFIFIFVTTLIEAFKTFEQVES